MCTSYAMMAFRVIPPIEDEEAEVDGAEEAGGAVVSIRGSLGLSCVSLRLMVVASMAATSMAPITEK